jgi:hypothetical protein
MRCVIGLLALGTILQLCAAASLAQAGGPRGSVEQSRLAKLRDIQRGAEQALERTGDYRVRLHRREMVSGRRNDDRLMLTVRHKPFSVHIKCLPGGENEGRQMIYVAGSSPEDTMSVLTGKGDILAGMRMDLSIRSERVTSQSRRTIAEAGFFHVVQRFNLALERYLGGQPKTSEFEPIGLQPRQESRAPMDVILQHIVAGEEPLLPHGGKRYWHFNQDADLPERHLPTLIITFDDRGQEVEYYFHDRLLPRLALDTRDFDPDRVWGKH